MKIKYINLMSLTLKELNEVSEFLTSLDYDNILPLKDDEYVDSSVCVDIEKKNYSINGLFPRTLEAVRWDRESSIYTPLNFLASALVNDEREDNLNINWLQYPDDDNIFKLLAKKMDKHKSNLISINFEDGSHLLLDYAYHVVVGGFIYILTEHTGYFKIPFSYRYDKITVR